jgi:hypothetical protein
MIDGVTSRALDRLDARMEDLSNQYEPGYIPTLDDDNKTSGPRAVASLDELHTTAPQDTFYVCVDAQGRRFYTRDGAFDLQESALRTKDGSSVLGFLPDAPAGSSPQALGVDPIDAVLGRASDAKIDADGTFEYSRKTIDPRTGAAKSERVVVGRLALARFPDGTRITAADGVHATAPAGVEAMLGVPKSDSFRGLVVHSDDRGGIDIQAGLSHLRESFLAFNVMQSAQNAHGHTDQVAMDLIK